MDTPSSRGPQPDQPLVSGSVRAGVPAVACPFCASEDVDVGRIFCCNCCSRMWMGTNPVPKKGS